MTYNLELTTSPSALFQVSLPAIAVGHRYASAYERGSRHKEQQNSLIDGSLAAFGTSLHVARTHRASLAEGRRDNTHGAQKNDRCQKCNPKVHFTPNIPLQPNFQLADKFSLHSQSNDTLRVRKEEDGHQDQARHDGAHRNPLHARNLIPQV